MDPCVGFGGLTVIAETNALKGNLKAAIAAKNAIYRLGRNKNPLMRTYNMLLTALLEADKYQEAEKCVFRHYELSIIFIILTLSLELFKN